MDSQELLTVEFDRPLDAGLLHHCLTLTEAEGTALAGYATITEGERSWRYESESEWRLTTYRLTVDPRLEDLAGNSLTRVFDRDLTREEDDPGPAPTTIEFRPSAHEA